MFLLAFFCAFLNSHSSSSIFRISFKFTFGPIFFFFLFYVYDCAAASLLPGPFLQLRLENFPSYWLLLWSTDFRGPGFSSCILWAQELWCRGLVAACLLGSLWTRETCLLQWQADFLPLSHQGSPNSVLFI